MENKCETCKKERCEIGYNDHIEDCFKGCHGHPKTDEGKCGECHDKPPVIPEYCGTCKRMVMGNKRIEVVGTLASNPHSDIKEIVDGIWNAYIAEAKEHTEKKEFGHTPRSMLSPHIRQALKQERIKALGEAKSAVEKVGWLHHGHPNTPFCYPTKSAPCENFAMRAALQAIEELIAKP